jgi:P4 family phage/plasmid primase-like protien
MKGTRDVREMTVAEFGLLVKRRGKTPSFTHQEYLKRKGKDGPPVRVKPYYDWDAKYKEEPHDLATEKRKQAKEFAETVGRLHPGAKVRYAQRHGKLLDAGEHKYKISYRAYIPDQVMALTDIPLHVRRVLGLGPKEVHEHLDLSVYKAGEQLVGVPYACKDTDQVKRYLMPIHLDSDWRDEEVSQDTVDLRDYLVQEVKTDATEVTIPTEAKAGGVAGGKKRGRPKKLQPGGTGDVTDITPTAGASGSAPTRLCGAEYREALQSASDIFGARFRLQEDFKSFEIDTEKRNLRLQPERTWCFIRRGTHQSNHQYILIDDQRGARYRCHDEECTTRVAGCSDLTVPWSELPQPIRDAFHAAFPEVKEVIDAELLAVAKTEYQQNITDNWPAETGLDIRRQKAVLTACAKHERCSQCDGTMRFEHSVLGLRMGCECGALWPPYTYIPLPQGKYPELQRALTVLNVNVGMVVNGDVNITQNIYNGSVEFYADYTHDNIQMFEDPRENELFIDSLQGTDMGLSSFAAYHFRNRFHCTSGKTWYEFRGHCWSDDAAKLAYEEALGEKAFVDAYQRTALQFENFPVQTDDVKRKARSLRKLAMSLEDLKFRERISNDSVIKFHRQRPNFAIELNRQNIIVFSDGVFDFDSCTFGPGSPDIAVSMCVPSPYKPYDPEHEHVKTLMSFMNDILPDEGVRDHTLKVLGVSLTNVVLQYFFIWTGSGGNGKGRLIRLMDECLGDYYQAVSPSMLTRKREEAHQANEALMSLVKARLAVFQEAESSDIIQAGVVKSITGNDTLSGRGNYGSQTKFRPTFKCLFVCNNLPKMSENTWGIWRRVKCTDFTVQFVENPCLSNERKIDHDLDSKLAAAAPWFIGILIEYFRRFKAEGLSEPPAITASTIMYRESQDAIKEFIEDHMIRVSDDSLLDWDVFRLHFEKVTRMKIPYHKASMLEKFRVHELDYIETTLSNHGKFKGFRGWIIRN